jgi:acetyltransferase-like isoleucine patch superfamily enzyme
VAVSLDRLHHLNLAKVRRRLADEKRARLVSAFAARALRPPPPSAFGAFGKDSVIVPPARITLPEAIEIGDRVVINEHAWLSVVDAVAGHTPRLRIDDDAVIDRLCHVACVGEIYIGRRVSMGERVLVGDTYHRYDDVTTPVLDQPMAEPRKVSIGAGTQIGLAVCILPGVTIGEQAFVGAGSVVTRDVPARAVAVGNPARVIKQFDEERGDWVDVPRGGS